jgi:hypothetical protein
MQRVEGMDRVVDPEDEPVKGKRLAIDEPYLRSSRQVQAPAAFFLKTKL